MFSNYFKRNEFEDSYTAKRNYIDNTIPDELLIYWKIMARNFLDKVRAYIDCPINVNCGYRSPSLNAITEGASSTSQHTGTWRDKPCCAVDIEIYKTDETGLKITDNAHLFNVIKDVFMSTEQDVLLPDQLIWERTDPKYNMNPAWVHVGFTFGYRPRGMLLYRPTGGPNKNEFVKYSESQIFFHNNIIKENLNVQN
jgi:hypothetical protein